MEKIEFTINPFSETNHLKIIYLAEFVKM